MCIFTSFFEVAHVYWTYAVPGELPAVVHSNTEQLVDSFLLSFNAAGPYDPLPPPEPDAVAVRAEFVLLHETHAPETHE